MSHHHDQQTTIEDDAAIARLLAQDMSLDSQPSYHQHQYESLSPPSPSSTFESDTALAQRMSMEQQHAQDTFESDAELARRLAAREEESAMSAQSYGGGGGGGIGRTLRGIVPPAPGNRRANNPPSRPTTTTTDSSSSAMNCPKNHGLDMFEVSPAQRTRCNVCGRTIQAGRRLHSCIECDYDICADCFDRGGPPPSQTTSSSSSSPFAATAAPRSSPFAQPQSAVPSNHMCVVPCIIGENGRCVEMLVDTGAQSSVISHSLARELQLDHRLDTRHRGVAAGVGRAAILGRIRHVICTMGNVEFDMDFMVLDVPDKMLLLGLDLMRKFRCIVDLERQRLVFGGMDGVAVEFLPPEEQHIPQAMMHGNNCPMM